MPEVEDVTFDEAVDRFVEDLTIRKVSPCTVKAYRTDLRVIGALLGPHEGPWSVSELSGKVLHKAFATHAATHAPASVSRARSTWSSLFDLLVRDGTLAGSPIAAVPMPRLGAREPKPLAGWDTDTVVGLITFVLTDCRRGRTVWPELDRVVVCLLLGTGLRASELLGLNLGSRETAQGDVSVRVIGKGGKPRTVPTPPPLPELMDDYQASRATRFPGWKPALSQPLLVGPAPRAPSADSASPRVGGRRLTTGQLDYLLRQVLAAAGLANRRPAGANAHAFRHTYGTLLAAEGTPVADLRGLMGHASLATTQGYIDSVARDRQAAAASNPALRHMRTGTSLRPDLARDSRGRRRSGVDGQQQDDDVVVLGRGADNLSE
ncbi:MAG: tyrosine-type recombinase/integrase [Acidimicrobiales bacterium]